MKKEEEPEALALSETNEATDTFDQLERLKNLLDTGVLSQDEFDTEKRRLLDRGQAV